MKLNDFLIKNKTGYVYQIVKVDGENIVYIKLGDSIRINSSIKDVGNEFNLLPFLSNEGKRILKLRQDLTNEQRNQFIVYDKYAGDFYVASSFILDEENYINLNNSLDKIYYDESLIKDFNEKLIKEINSYKDDSLKRVVVSKIKSKNDFREDDSKDYITNNKKDENDKDLDFVILEPSNNDSMENIILHPLTKDKLDESLVKHKFGSFINRYLQNETVTSNSGALVLNLYGKPGTGKTISVKAFANKINRKILMVDFAQLISKMVGDTGKNIQKYFQKAKEENLIILFDEADTLIQKRSSDGDVHSYYANQNQNIFMRELDKFDGIVFLTTNLFENYDPAMLRRITSIEYPLPTKEMRELIIKKHLSLNAKYDKRVNPSILADLTEGFSGGDIKNLTYDVGIKHINRLVKENEDEPIHVVENIIENNAITLDLFIEEIKNINKTKNNYLGKKESSLSGIKLL